MDGKRESIDCNCALTRALQRASMSSAFKRCTFLYCYSSLHVTLLFSYPLLLLAFIHRSPTYLQPISSHVLLCRFFFTFILCFYLTSRSIKCIRPNYFLRQLYAFRVGNIQCTTKLTVKHGRYTAAGDYLRLGQ
ncbi:hypothetical protein RvY_08966 [Ramazzottius varieornatus]|uniref:Uncharacterized protein n=1 Tax=Ramazzottius varieornatus TaxID=947166 RepID=A0A1D1VGW4_RAMVA|nr:hypothetical protein RvY_08966 [Ramazzottius varieornatus]